MAKYLFEEYLHLNRNDKDKGDETIPRNKGNQSLRSTLTVECLKMNESKFHGSVHYQEAKNKIFLKALGLPASLLKSVKMCFNKGLNIQFILHKEIDITKLPAVNFHIERK